MHKGFLTQFEEHDRRIFWTLSFFILVLLGLYLYFLSVSVFDVVSRRSAESSMGSLNSKIAQLESEYAVLDKKIDLALAHDRGFLDVSVPTYLIGDKKDTSLTLRSSQDNER